MPTFSLQNQTRHHLKFKIANHLPLKEGRTTNEMRKVNWSAHMIACRVKQEATHRAALGNKKKCSVLNV